MNIRTQFEPAPVSALSALRARYLDALTLGQEASVEVLVAGSAAFLVKHRAETIGYFLVSGGATLIEFYLEPRCWVFGERVLAQILQRTGVRRAFVKTFDALMLVSCLPWHQSVSVRGIMARDYLPRSLPDHPELTLAGRLANAADFAALWAVDQAVFRDEARLRHVVGQGHVYVYFRDAQLVGFGLLKPVVAGRPEVELGFAVDAPYRRRGYAVYILRDLADRALAAGQTPIAACAADNKVSRLTAERIGFVSRYQLLDIALSG